jgi:hypothetical protein
MLLGLKLEKRVKHYNNNRTRTCKQLCKIQLNIYKQTIYMYTIKKERYIKK